MNTNYVKATIEEKKADEFTAVASSSVVDRQGEVIQQTGWDLKNFKANPILLWMHDHTKPLGKATRVWLDKTGGTPVLKFKGVISDATEWGKAAKQLMEEGILNSFSVGFRANEIDDNTITKAELYEISLVTVPANPEARLVAGKALKDAGISEDITKEFEVTELESLKLRVKELEAVIDSEKELQSSAPSRSKQEIVTKRLELSKVVAKAADRLIVESKSPKTVNRAKMIKIASEKLISDMKGDL
jgi:HK97 family phage prohead protease